MSESDELGVPTDPCARVRCRALYRHEHSWPADMLRNICHGTHVVSQGIEFDVAAFSRVLETTGADRPESLGFRLGGARRWRNARAMGGKRRANAARTDPWWAHAQERTGGKQRLEESMAQNWFRQGGRARWIEAAGSTAEQESASTPTPPAAQDGAAVPSGDAEHAEILELLRKIRWSLDLRSAGWSLEENTTMILGRPVQVLRDWWARDSIGGITQHRTSVLSVRMFQVMHLSLCAPHSDAMPHRRIVTFRS